MRKILLVSGCSYTDKNFISSVHPKMYTFWPKWPEILAEKLDMQCINVARSGTGQEYIFSTLLDTIQSVGKENIGMMIAGWSTAARRDYASGIKQMWSNDRIDYRGDLEYWINRSVRYYYTFQEISKHLKIPFRQVQMVNLFKSYLWELKETGRISGWKEYQTKKREQITKMMNNPYFNLLESTFIGWPTFEELGGFSIERHVIGEDYKISEKDRHPNAEGQKRIAEFLYDRLG